MLSFSENLVRGSLDAVSGDASMSELMTLLVRIRAKNPEAFHAFMALMRAVEKKSTK